MILVYYVILIPIDIFYLSYKFVRGVQKHPLLNEDKTYLNKNRIIWFNLERFQSYKFLQSSLNVVYQVDLHK